MSAMQMNALEDAIFAWILFGSGLAADHVIWAAQNSPAPSGPYVTIRMRTIRPLGNDWVDVENNYQAIAAVTFTADALTNQLATGAAHTLNSGDGPIRLTTTGTLPAAVGGNLAAGIDYWTIRDDATHVRLARTHVDAVAASPVAIDLTSAGTGTHTLDDSPTFARQGAEVNYRARGMRRVTLTITCYGDSPIGAAGPSSVVGDVLSAVALPSRSDALAAAGVGISDLGEVVAIDGVVDSTLLEPRAFSEVVFFATSELVETGTYIEHVQVTNQVPTPNEVFNV